MHKVKLTLVKIFEKSSSGVLCVAKFKDGNTITLKVDQIGRTRNIEVIYSITNFLLKKEVICIIEHRNIWYAKVVDYNI